jgi:glutaredoxin 3
MKIITYTTPTCPWSAKLRTWLKRRRHQFEDWDVTEPQNKLARDELLNKSNQLAVPLIDIDGKILIGFDEKELAATIAASK